MAWMSVGGCTSLARKCAAFTMPHSLHIPPLDHIPRHARDEAKAFHTIATSSAGMHINRSCVKHTYQVHAREAA
eukprot:scaffold171586_cov21-Tisochrysis_lutea.AAC.3